MSSSRQLQLPSSRYQSEQVCRDAFAQAEHYDLHSVVSTIEGVRELDLASPWLFVLFVDLSDASTETVDVRIRCGAGQVGESSSPPLPPALRRRLSRVPFEVAFALAPRQRRPWAIARARLSGALPAETTITLPLGRPAAERRVVEVLNSWREPFDRTIPPVTIFRARRRPEPGQWTYGLTVTISDATGGAGAELTIEARTWKEEDPSVLGRVKDELQALVEEIERASTAT